MNDQMANWKNIVNIFLLASLGNAFGQLIPSPVVQVEQGQVQGSIKHTPEGRQFCAYQGIPYGKAPTGPLRFKAPLPADPWSGVLQVTSDPVLCMQISTDGQSITKGGEDCLQLVVFTPQLPTNSTNPMFAVQVYVHGGAYAFGGIDYVEVNPERYMNVDMVVVAMTYRVGPLGFLATDDEAASGNWGLLDQNLALKWVQKNIAAFGGNPNDVTLTGQSAGSSAVAFQYLSPMSAGLFHRAIAESGMAISQWVLQRNPAYYARAMGEHFNCTTDNTTQLIECLRQIKAEDITAHSEVFMVENVTLCFTPSVETSPNGQFLTEDPLTMLESGNFNHVPFQLGFNRDEGCLISNYVFSLFENVTDETFDVYVPNVLSIMTGYTTNLINVSYAMKDQYYANVDWNNQTQVNIATYDWTSDIFMKNGVAKTASLVSSYNVPTYLYAYNYVSSQSPSNRSGEPDVLHGQELRYLWYRNITNSKDSEFGNLFFQLWTDFILNGKHGDTAGTDDPWLPTPPGQYNYYDIQEQFTMRGNYNPDHMNFWWNTVPAIVNA